MAAENKKPVVCVYGFVHHDKSHGIIRAFEDMLKDSFTIVTTWDIESDPSLLDNIEGAVCNPMWDHRMLALMDKMPRLKTLGCFGVGYDFLDLEWCSRRGIQVGNTPGVVSTATADLGISLLLAAARKLTQGIQEAMSREPVREFSINVFGKQVTGSTLGIVGMGRIGYEAAKRARGFDMRILYHNRHQRCQEDEVSVGAMFCASLHDMLPQCDFLILTCPLTKQTDKLIGQTELKIMKNTAIIVNIARGQVIDQDALVAALRGQEIQGAALDVTYPEPLPRDHPLLHLPSVIITPHCGCATLETITQMWQMVVDNLKAALVDGKPMPNEVPLPQPKE